MHYTALIEELERLNRESGVDSGLARISFEAAARFFYLPFRRAAAPDVRNRKFHARSAG
jgi:hypothetical protein